MCTSTCQSWLQQAKQGLRDAKSGYQWLEKKAPPHKMIKNSTSQILEASISRVRPQRVWNFTDIQNLTELEHTTEKIFLALSG